MYKTIKLFTTKNIHVTIYNNYYKTAIQTPVSGTSRGGLQSVLEMPLSTGLNQLTAAMSLKYFWKRARIRVHISTTQPYLDKSNLATNYLSG